MRVLHVAFVIAALATGITTAHSADSETPDRPAATLEHALRRTVTSPPSIDDLRVVVISDLNGSYGTTTYEASVHDAIARIIQIKPDVVLVSGDMVAGQRGGLDYRAMWRGFHRAVSDPLAASGIPLAVAPGNHDASSYPGFGTERAIYASEWEARKPDLEYVDDSNFPFYYSYVVGSAFFVALDVTRVGLVETEQLEWLSAQLEVSRHYTTKIVYGHLPLHPFAQQREEQYIRDSRVEELLVAYDVTMFVSGHHHTYYPGRQGEMRTVGVGCLGAGARRLIGESRRSRKSFLMFDVIDGEIANLDGYAGEDFTEVIDRATLPAQIVLGYHRIIRDDLWQPPPNSALLAMHQ